jgi:dihydropteroate synthase
MELLQSKPKPMHSSTRPHNAHLIRLHDEEEITRNLAALGLTKDQVEANASAFQYGTVKLKAVNIRSAALLRNRIQALGGSLASAVTTAGEGLSPDQVDVLMTGSYAVLGRLTEGLAEEDPRLVEIGREISRCLQPKRGPMVLGNRSLDFRARIYVMGILNCTPDSFYPGSRVPGLDQALEQAWSMIDAGADILDVGGESTRPGSDPVETAQEIERVVPVIAGIRKRSDVLISIDTRKTEVAEKALDAGADLVNDVSALRGNRPLAECIAARGVPVILMHMRGEPKNMQENPHYEDTIAEVIAELSSSIDFALSSGIAEDRIIIDPGIGFGKRCQDNLAIIRGLSALHSLGCPVVMGLSRKSFIGTVLDKPVEGRLIGTVAANMLALMNGADILRVHDVGEAVDTVKIFEAVQRG